jgi:hypothetical protein
MLRSLAGCSADTLELEVLSSIKHLLEPCIITSPVYHIRRPILTSSFSLPQQVQSRPEASTTRIAIKDFYPLMAHFHPIFASSISHSNTALCDILLPLRPLTLPPSFMRRTQFNTVQRRMIIMMHSCIFTRKTLEISFCSFYICMP